MRIVQFSKMKNKIYIALLLGAVLLGSAELPGVDNVGVVKAAETVTTDVEQLSKYPINEHWVEPVKITGESDLSITPRGASLYDAKYDPRNVNGAVMVSSIRDQGQYGTCWAFSTIAAAESNLIKNGYADASIDLSENHFGYFFYNRQTDSLRNTVGDSNNYSISNAIKYGNEAWAYNAGTIQGSGLALATWAGLTTESVSPYISVPDISMCYMHDYSVRDVYYYDYDINAYAASVSRIKQAIIDHGAVASGIYMELTATDANNKLAYSDYYNVKTGAYYYNKKDGNHAVAIVGWDDTYSRNNFGKVKPSRDGAWIIKNSYGTGIADKGFFYVSYEDASLSEMMAMEMVPLSMQYDNNYQYDGSAIPGVVPLVKNALGQTSNLPNGTKYANVFTAKASRDKCEELQAVSVCLFSANTSYTVDIYTGLSSAKNPTSGTKAVSTSGVLVNAGYQTIALPKSVALVPGEKFSVVVTLFGNYSSASMGAEGTGSAQNGWISFQAGGGANQSFIYLNKKWNDYYTAARGNLRIKAFTNYTAQAPSIRLSDSSLGISKGSSKALSLVKSPVNIYRKVSSWSSSNKGVATVSKKGKVTAKSYGTAKITAKVMKGSKKATLKCKVTVGPKKLKGFKASGGKRKITAKWKGGSDATGYTVYYSTEKNGKYKTLADIGKRSVTKCSKKKIAAGVYYVKMRPYLKKGKKKLYGSYTSVKQVSVK